MSHNQMVAPSSVCFAIICWNDGISCCARGFFCLFHIASPNCLGNSSFVRWGCCGGGSCASQTGSRDNFLLMADTVKHGNAGFHGSVVLMGLYVHWAEPFFLHKSLVSKGVRIFLLKFCVGQSGWGEDTVIIPTVNMAGTIKNMEIWKYGWFFTDEYCSIVPLQLTAVGYYYLGKEVEYGFRCMSHLSFRFRTCNIFPNIVISKKKSCS